MRLLLLMFLFPFAVSSQTDTFQIPKSKYGLPVIGDRHVYQQLLKLDPDNRLVDMKKLLPQAHYDVTYATTHNILKRKIYPTHDVFMRKPAADALVQVVLAFYFLMVIGHTT
jgi:D-alanyl-D-alanine dipeptidase